MMLDVSSSSHSWFHDRIVLGLTALANGAAWAQSFASNNISVGGIVTFCTIAIPAVVGGVIYILKNLGPVWLQFLADRDKIRSSTLGGRLDALTAELVDARRAREATDALAAINQRAADEARRLVELTERRANDQGELNRQLGAQMADISGQLTKARESLHAIRGESSAIKMQAEADKVEWQARLDEANAQLHQANAQLDDLRRQNAGLMRQITRELTETTRRVDNNEARLDQITSEPAGPGIHLNPEEVAK